MNYHCIELNKEDEKYQQKKEKIISRIKKTM